VNESQSEKKVCPWRTALRDREEKRKEKTPIENRKRKKAHGVYSRKKRRICR